MIIITPRRRCNVEDLLESRNENYTGAQKLYVISYFLDRTSTVNSRDI